MTAMKPIEKIRRENLAKAIDEKFSGSQTAAAECLGKDKPTQVNHWVRGTKNMNGESARNIEKKFGLPEFWLDSEHVSADADKPKKGQIPGMIALSAGGPRSTLGERILPNPTPDEYVLVPQLDIEAACGEGRFHDHVIVDGGKTFAKTELRDLGVPEHAARLIYAAGGSMAPKIQDGRAVLVNLADREPRDNKIYAICTPDDGLVLKRLIWDFHPAAGQQTWIIRSDNPDKAAFPDKLLPPDDRTMIAGRAVWTDSLL